MPEINYNNPDFEWVLEDTYSWDSTSTDYFITDFSYQARGTGLQQTGTCTAKPCITTFAKQGFLLLLDVSGTYSGLTEYIGPSAINISYDSTTGVFTIPFNRNSKWQRTDFTLNNIYILSYRKRFLSFSLDPLEIHNNDWTSNHTLCPNLILYKYSCNKTNLKIKNCFSLLKDEWVYYDTDSATSVISSIDEYPIYKYLITDAVDDNHLIYTKTTSTTITWPQGSRERALLKSRGSHYLINNSNELQKRDFSAVEDDTKGISNTQRYDQLGATTSSGPTRAFLIQDGFNQIMHNKTSFNKKINLLDMPSTFQYFNNDRTYTPRPITWVYTDLWDNNHGPTLSDPYILYNNMNTLVDSGSSKNLWATDLSSNLFWVDPYTLYCTGQVYFIPSNWKICIFQRAADNSALTFNQIVPSDIGSITLRSNEGSATAIAELENYNSQWTLNESSFSSVKSNYLLDTNNSYTLTDISSAWELASGSLQYDIEISDYAAEISFARSRMRLFSSSHNVLTVNYNIWLPKFIEPESYSTTQTYTPQDDTYAVVNNSAIKLTSDIIRQSNASGYISRIYESLEFKLPEFNGLTTKTNISVDNHLKSSYSTINLTNGTYSYMEGDQTSSTFHGYQAGAYYYHGINASRNNPNSYCIVAYGPDWGEISLSCTEDEQHWYHYMWTNWMGVNPVAVVLSNGTNLVENTDSGRCDHFVYAWLVLKGTPQSPTQVLRISKDMMPQPGETKQYYYTIDD